MKINFLLLCLLMGQFAWSQNGTNFWQDVVPIDLNGIQKPDKTLQINQYRALTLDVAALKKYIQAAPMENTDPAKTHQLYLDLPLPDGTMETFAVVESPIMEPELAARYPNIKTYQGKNSHTGNTVRFDLSPRGFHALILDKTVAGEIYIDSYADEQNGVYLSYWGKDYQKPVGATFSCGYETDHTAADEKIDDAEPKDAPILPRSNALVNLRKFRLAVATTGEFTQRFNAPTKEAVLSVIVQLVNRVNSVYERDVAIRFVLAAKTDTVFFLDPATDPYTNSSSVSQCATQNTAVLDRFVGSANYDLGHVVISGGGGAGVTMTIPGQPGNACRNELKGNACSSILDIDIYAYRTLAHEMGHQLSAQHSWNNCPPEQIQLEYSSAYEPGSGSTIMSYADACGDQNIQSSSDRYFHVRSIEEMLTYIRTGAAASCGTVEPTTNDEPVITLNFKDGFFIPISTPFELTGSATDANNNALTYCWEQFDLGPVSSLGTPVGNAPIFRSFPPTTTPTRVFPRLQTIITNIPTVTEVLPTYDRELSFRLTVRDNNPGAGASAWKQVKFKSTSSAGPFLVLYPNEDTVSWMAGTYAEVRWDVAKTTNNLVNCRFVTIKLSLDGGLTYPITLAKGVSNNGKTSVPVPDVATASARIRVEADDNIFFDISNQNFKIVAATQPNYTLNATPRSIRQQCLPQPITFSLSSKAFAGFNKNIALSIEGSLPTDVTAIFTKNTLSPNDSTKLTITFGKQVQQEFNLIIKGTTDDSKVVSIPIYFNTISNDFSELKMLAPALGKSDISLSTDFRWNKLSNVQTYDFELATSPTFGSTRIATIANLTDTFYRPQVFFDANKVYYWRIRPVNECGSGAFLEPSVFRTLAVQCAQTASTSVPLNISGTGLPTVNSTLNITSQGTINDVNIPLIKAEYSPVKSLRVSLISPGGTEVILFDQHCGNTLKFESGFDDEAPAAVATACPPDDRLVVRPTQALSAFKGQNTAGTWTLRTKVMSAGFGSGGSISSWNIEFCSTLNPNNPFVIKNDTLKVPPGKTNTYTKNQLEIQDTDNSAAQLKFTLVSLPKNGTLVRGSTNLNIGDTFTQQDITNFQLKYIHNGNSALSDSFTFIVEDGVGGWLPTQRAFIKIDANATVGVNDLLDNNKVTVFPNPTRDLLNVQFVEMPKGSVNASLFNAQGQEVFRQRFDQAENVLQIRTNQLLSGIYFLTLRTVDGLVTKKVTVQH